MQRFDVGYGSDVHGEIYLITGEMQPTEVFWSHSQTPTYLALLCYILFR